MGKKSSSCFRLITCGGDPSEKDDHHRLVSENNSKDKRHWSFRKKSAKHRVLSNTAVTEAASSANKRSSECTSISVQPLTEPDVVEKVYTTDFSDEKPQLSNLASSETAEAIVVAEPEGKEDVHLPESDIIIIQAAIRGFLAQRALLKSKNVVKLQAAVRGHLVRKHAVGTLRCVQAIVKMQLLVRARNAKQSRSENLLSEEDGKHDRLKTSGREHEVRDTMKSNVTHASIEKLLKNRFASQLLESTPKNKPTRIKCDPSKADSAWKWLERWMSVSSKDSPEFKNVISMSEQSDEIKDSSDITQSEKSIPSEVLLQTSDYTPTVADLHLLSKDEEKTTTYDANNSNIEARSSTSSLVQDNLENPPSEKTITDDAKVISTENDSFHIKKPESEEEKMVTTYGVDNFNFQESHFTTSLVEDNLLEQAPTEREITDDAKVHSAETDFVQNGKTESLDASVQEEPSSLTQKPEIDGKPHKQSTETFASDQLETEGKKSVHGSRKFSNPAFVAAQSKFEELSSKESSGRSSSLSNQDGPVESQEDTSLLVSDTVHRSEEFVPSEDLAPYPSRIGCSESGTELSISSTLDSPERSEIVIMDSEHDAKDLAERIDNPENKIDNGVEAKTPCATPASNIPNTDSNILENVHNISHNMVPSVNVADSKESAVDPQENPSEEKETVLQDPRLSPKASPKSHVTILESQGTPSSQVSVKTKDSKVNKSGSSSKRRLLSVGNKSPANVNHDLGGSRSSREQLPKDQLSGKRRKSFGSVKSDQVDQEERDDSSSNSPVPRFMQATESARAKISANNSPRSSPDVHDQDIPIKKRHSLAAGKQGSPRVEGSTSFPQPGTKGNGVHTLHERKWQR